MSLITVYSLIQMSVDGIYGFAVKSRLTSTSLFCILQLLVLCPIASVNPSPAMTGNFMALGLHDLSNLGVELEGFPHHIDCSLYVVLLEEAKDPIDARTRPILIVFSPISKKQMFIHGIKSTHLKHRLNIDIPLPNEFMSIGT